MPVNVAGAYTDESFDDVLEVLERNGCCPQLIHFHRLEGGEKIDLQVLARLGPKSALKDVTDQLYGIRGVSQVRWG